jgi:hypothetical protein
VQLVDIVEGGQRYRSNRLFLLVVVFIVLVVFIG